MGVLVLAFSGCTQQPQAQKWAQKWAMDYIGPKIMKPLQLSQIASSSGKMESSKDFLGKVVVLYCILATRIARTCVRPPCNSQENAGPPQVFLTPSGGLTRMRQVWGRSQENAGPPQVSLTSTGVGLGAARPWGRSEIDAITRRYRVAYSYGKPDTQDNYVVDHSAGVYIFGRSGRIHLLGSDSNPPTAWVHDLKQLIADEA